MRWSPIRRFLHLYDVLPLAPFSALFATKASHTYTINDNDAAPAVEFATASSSGPETVSPATLVVSLSGVSAQTVTVDYSVTGGTATGGGVDYTLAAGKLTLSPGDTAENVAITIVDDSSVEGNETVIVTLNNPVNATLGTNVSHTYTIINDYDETPPEISGLIPGLNSFQVCRDTIIQMHITDGGSGVEYTGGTVTIQVEGDLIYDGANESPEGVYDSRASSQAVKGICRRTGAAADYTFVFQASTLFDYEQKVDVVVSATDKVGNAMTETYYFYTVMREFGKNVKVNSDTGTLVQNRPATGTDSAGNIWVAWDQTTAAGDTDIYVGKLQTDSSTFGSSVQVAGSADYERNPAIAIDNGDTIYVVWQGDDLSGKWDIFASTSVDGTSWSSPVKVNGSDPNNESDQTSPAIAIDGNNKAYVVWEDYQAGNKDIWMASSTNGTTWSEQRITGDSQRQTEPTIAIDASDVVFIGWTDWRNQSTAGMDIYGAASDEGPWNNVALVVTASNQSSPVGGLSSDGVIHLLWVDDRNGNNDIYYAGATTIGPPLPTTTSTMPQGTTIVELNGANTGYVDDASDVLVEIPAGATPSDITVTISEIRNLPELPSGAFGVYYDFGPSGLQLTAPATITIPHAAGDCPELPIYRVYWYNTQIGAWSTTGVSNVKHLDDTAPNIASGLHAVQFNITHFTTFGASAGAAPPSGGGGGGGGGGGCSLSQNDASSAVEFLLPYAAFIIVLLAISCVDARRRRSKSDGQ